jgi:signal transduction histidine kinase
MSVARHPSSLRAAALPLLLLVLLAGVNTLAVAGMVVARRNARSAALQDLRLQAEQHARAVEVSLAALRRDLVNLSRAPELRATVGSAWSGAGSQAAESLLLAQLADQPALRAIALRDPPGAPLVLAGRSATAPTLLPLTSDPPAPIGAPTLHVAQLPVAGGDGGRGLLEVWIDLDRLLELASPGAGAGVELRTQEGDAPPPEPGQFEARALVDDGSWPIPIRWTLTRRESEGHVLESVTELSARYRRTVFLNLGVIVSTVLLGVLSIRQVRRAALLEAESRQQARLRELERQMLHSERLASVGRMAAGVAHEVNNPLEGMSNYLTLLEEDLAAGEIEAARRLVPRVRDGLDRVAAVIRGMLALSDSGRGGNRRLDLRAPVEQALGFVGSQPAFRSITFRRALSETEVAVDGNPTTMGQLLLNLILNAAQSQPAGGDVEVTCEARGGRAVVRVADRGPGFAPAVLERLFEPFQSTRGSSGLGLAICHAIARDHGGSLRAGNRPQGGAEVVLDLPLAVPGGEREEAP